MTKQKTRTRTSTSDRTTAYAHSVLSGEIVAGPHVRDACQRHLNDLKDGNERGLVWDLKAAKHWIKFFETQLKLNGGRFEGKPFTLLPWQAFIVGSLFGWKREDGFRRFRVAYIETGKGSGKSPLAAGIGLGMLCADGEERAEVYAAAVKQEQARILFRDAVAMVQQSPALSKRLDLTGGAHPDNIAFMRKGSFFRPVSSERQGRGQSGPRPHCVLLDEIHEHPTNAMVEFLSAGVKNRTQPLTVMITNSGSDRQTVCWDYHSYAVQIADGTKEDDGFFGYVCGLDKDDEPFEDESCWIKANPSLPDIPGYDYIRGEVTRSRGMPSKETLTRRLNFCQWTDAADAWISSDIWKAVQATLDIEEYKDRECFGGLDLSQTSDLTAFVLVFPSDGTEWEKPTEGQCFDVFSWFWMAGDRLLELQDRDSMAPRYQQWRDAGYLQAPSGKTIDYRHAAELIGNACKSFKVKGVAYDRHKIEAFRWALEEVGIEVPLVEHGQGFFTAKETGLWLPSSIDELENALIEERLRVNESPVLTWNVASTVCQNSNLNPSDRYFSKQKSTARIDGSVALAMAMGVATMREEPPPRKKTLANMIRRPVMVGI